MHAADSVEHTKRSVLLSGLEMGSSTRISTVVSIVSSAKPSVSGRPKPTVKLGRQCCVLL
jgi:hypothetical protein